MKSHSDAEQKQDSKVSRFFLRKVLEALGQRVPQELEMNSWELYELISKDINIIHAQMRRDRKNIKGLLSSDEDRRQFTISAIEKWYKKGELVPNEEKGWYDKMETLETDQVVRGDED